MSEPTRIVIVGGVACGPKAAARARRLDPRARITIVERGDTLSYAGCGLPYRVAGDVEDCLLNHTSLDVPRDAAFFHDVKDIQVLDRTLARWIDRENKRVEVEHVETGMRSAIPYGKLVLVTSRVLSSCTGSE